MQFKFESLQDGIAPNFTQKPTIKPDADGKRLCFECKIKADPEPQLYWFRDNVEIVNKCNQLQSKIKILFGFNKYAV